MKDKPISHKNQNTFHFLTFAERLSNINIDVIRRVQKVIDTAEDANTFFQEAIEKWDDLNYTEDYAALVKEIGSEVRTLSQIVLRVDEIAEILLKHLRKPENLALDAILELVVALSRDLQMDFYNPYFPKFFVAITQCLCTKDTDVLEKIFTCLSYLFKFLWRYMVKDMENVYRLFSTLLNDTNKMYIRNFAAESFAFLMRKVPNKTALFEFIFCMLMDNPEQTQGVGQLLFETVKGVKHRFHTCSEEVLRLLVTYLGKGLKVDWDQSLQLEWSLVQQALLQMLKSMAKHTAKENSTLVQNILCDTTVQLLNNLQTEEIERDSVVQHLSNVLHLFIFWVKYHDGMLVVTDKKTIKVLSDLSQATDLPEPCFELIIEIIASFYLSPYIQMPVECIGDIISSIYTYPSRKLVFQFTRRMFAYGLFEKDVLPSLLEYCTASLRSPSSEDEEDILEMLAEFVTNLRPLINSGEDIEHFLKMNLNSNVWGIRNQKQSSDANHVLEDLIVTTIKKGPSHDSNVSKLWCALICIPHLRISDGESAAEHIQNVIRSVQDALTDYSSVVSSASGDVEYPTFFLSQAVISWILIDMERNTHGEFPYQFFVDLITKYPKSVSILQMTSIFLYYSVHVKKLILPEDMFSAILPHLLLNLASPFHKVRLFTLQILCSFDLPLPLLEDDVVADQSLFSICLEAEKIHTSIQDYREKLKMLQQLEYPSVKKYIPTVLNDQCFQAPIYYLLGTLYINFRLLWQPAQKLLESFARGVSKPFWNVFDPYLQNIISAAEAICRGEDDPLDSSAEYSENQIRKMPVFQKNMLLTCKHSEIPDTLNHRELLWRAMGSFPDVVEPRNKDVVPLLFRFINETEDFDEQCEASSSKVSSRDETSSYVESKESRIKGKKCLIKALSVYLTLFTKFKNPKAFHRTEELQILYYELLSHHEAGIQKLAFDCIMTYNYKYLVPYKENFYNILDDKSFKTEVVLFSLDESNGVIEEEHRMKLMPVLMRILYGKMLRKTGNNTTGKAQAHTRRSIVLRFLAGCRAEELKLFLNLAFAPFKEQLESGDILSIVKNIRTNIDLSSVVPVRKQHSALNTLGTVLKHLGSLVPQLLPWLLKVLLTIAATSSVLLERRNEVLSHCVTRLKSVRTLSVDKLIQFFTSFNQYNFSKEEIDAIFEAVVWPMLPRLEFEALHQPPPLLRLLATWSENPRFFVLFAKYHESSKSLSPLPHLMSLYTAAKVQPKVIAHISKMLNQLLISTNPSLAEKESSIPELKINFCLEVTHPENCALEDKDSISYGTLLLLPHINMILKRLRAIVTKVAKNPKMPLNSCDLSILLRISEHVEDPEQSSDLIELLIPALMKRKRLSEDAEAGVLSTINNLMRNVDHPRKFIKSLCPLFALLSYQGSRISLVEIFKTMSMKEHSLQSTLDIISKINAWDPSHSQREIEPDYQLRLDGHALAMKVINNMSHDIDEDFIRIIIFNSSYVIRLCDDLSLRDSASYLLQQLTKKFAEFISHDSDSFKVIVLDTLMPEVQKGLKNKTEAVRHEFIKILASVLHNCGSHPRLQSLGILCDKDEDMDFWQNISHVQVHRRARALLRFSRSLGSGELSFHPYLLMTYITPIVTSILFDTAYKKHIDVVDAAVETTGSIAKTLPWPRYESTLRYYLNLLSRLPEHHKTTVKVIVAILNAFHFDLSASRGIQSNLKEPPIKVTKVTPEENDVVMNPEGECEPMEVCETSELSKDDEKAAENSSSLDEEKATKIHHIIAKSILPQLHRSLTRKTRRDEEHKLAGQYHPEDDEILRVPIALAMVKLLQNLPHDSLKVNLPGIFLKMCNFLKSRAESIRETARETLIKMMQSLGPSYLWYLLREMKGVLRKGYQVHVMNYTVSAILSKLKDHLTSSDLDSCVEILTEVCNNELFGSLAEEKEVAQITGKLKEARGKRSHTLYQILSLFISEDRVPKLIRPLKQVLSDTHSHKTVKKVQDCLRHIAEGLSENKGISPEYLLKFVQETISESITSLNNNRNNKPVAPMKSPSFVRPDIFVIPKEPPRGGIPATTSMKTNAHVLVEFGLLLLHLYTKKEKSKLMSGEEHWEVLNQFIPDLADCLACNYIKIISVTLRCLMWLYKFPLPSLKTTTETIVNSLFILLNKYAGEGMGQGDNFEMVVMCFKMVTVLVKDTDYHKWTSEQLKVLLSYIEQDIHSYNRQATAFNLLKAVLFKKLETPELSGIMCKVAEMSINSEQEHIRTQCRQVSLQYLLDYPLGKKIEDKLAFFVTQLEYFHEYGRISAIEMINSILSAFPPDEVKKYASGLFLLPLATRLVNDEASKCRKMAAATIKSMLKKIGHDERSNLFSIVFTLLQNKKVSHRRLGAQLCGIFAEVEGDKFERHLDDLLPVVEEQIKAAEATDIESYTDERCTDHFLFHILNALSKMFSNCSVIRNRKHLEKLNCIWEALQQLILHPHLWVRLSTGQLFGFLFASFSVDDVLAAMTEESSEHEMIFFASRQKLRDLSADFATQLQSPYLNEDLGEQIIRNLIYLAKVISRLSQTDSEQKNMDTAESVPDDDEEEENVVTPHPTVTLNWMIRRLCREVKKEISQSPQSTVKRKCVFKFLAAVALDLGEEKVLPILSVLLQPLCRELADSTPNPDLSVRKLAQEVIDLLRNIVDVEVFTKEYADVHRALYRKKAKRKHDKAMEAATDAVAFARKKIKKQQNKKKVKKYMQGKNSKKGRTKK